MLIPKGCCKHLSLYLPGTGKASQETAISGSFQQNLAGVGSLWMGLSSVSAPNFVSTFPPVTLLFTLL
ncbi:hypothetical protein T4D_10970 [Trichinella pseudospiralis]|uniref:Uncharacterized protein n=1 Tax=Trichinella pseudospiralis TaxID=6337 RepID=A0A0V1DNT2_TRIPS|nr:hypothetical protein T4D_10970 [Trichinella pseudospiralis]